MSHKTEAEKLLYLAYNEMSDSEGFFEVQAALAEATLALVEAQEAANEQARIANLIALGVAPGVSFEVHEQVIAALTQDAGNDVYPLAPEIARALGIGGAE